MRPSEREIKGQRMKKNVEKGREKRQIDRERELEREKKKREKVGGGG